MRSNHDLVLERSHWQEPTPAELYAAIIDSADDAIISKNLDGIVQSWNRSAERIFGYTAEEIVGKSITMLFPPDRMHEEPQILARLRSGERVDHYGTVRVTKDGRHIPVSVTISPIKDRCGNVIGASKIVRDLSSHHDADRTRAHFVAIVESADDAIVSKDLNGIVQSWNRGAQRLFGYDPEEIVGKSITLLIPSERLQEESEILSRIRRGDRVEHFDTVRRAKDGHLIPVSLTVSPIKDAYGTIIGASKIARDISDRLAAENALREADRSKDEFLAMLAHELRNPLTPIRTGIDIIQKNLGDQKRREWALQVVDRQLVQLTRVIDDLLELARIVNGSIVLKKETIGLRKLVSNALEACRPHINARRHNVRIDLPIHDVPLYVDPVRMEQAIFNLLSNAAKYMEPAGTIVVDAEVGSDNKLTLRVKDSGRGIEAPLLPQIFDALVQDKQGFGRKDSGLGIGLSIVRRIVELHEGRVSAYSRGQNTGSEFSIQLPLSARGLAIASDAAEEKSVPVTRRRVLIVDDNRDVADVIAEYLSLKGYETAQHYHGDGAIEKILSFKPDAVVLDLGLPGRDGFEVARAVREHADQKNLPLIAISGYGQPADIERTRSAGINHHMLKPIDAELLVKLIEASLRPTPT